MIKTAFLAFEWHALEVSNRFCDFNIFILKSSHSSKSMSFIGRMKGKKKGQLLPVGSICMSLYKCIFRAQENLYAYTVELRVLRSAVDFLYSTAVKSN